ncbi:FecR family protein [Pedobacter mendelii]|uniref:Anti-sigma factor n=1 Tax=Pedobacter mendelii TaxID=1908240 RepID=A0ABQ2BHE8_9SPHI|nr:FecR family protein [Pedobacter mendelii]GGI25710.1 anti-sigma factor [Pedobacter mendelii]
MNKAYIHQLLRKFIEKDLSSEEFLKLKEILADPNYEPLIHELMAEEWEMIKPVLNFSKGQSEYLFKRITKDKRFTDSIQNKKKHFRMLINTIKIAACFFVVLISALVIYNYHNPQSPDYVYYTSPLGKRSYYLFPDGSKVWLNAGTKVRIAKDFQGKFREVFLEGEAFFDVVHNTKKPFIIHTGNILTQVLGTAFNVSAYPKKNISVVVLRGKVGVKDAKRLVVFVNPNQQLAYDFKTSVLKTEQVNAELYTSWTKGELELNDVSVEEAAEIISRWYNVKIVFKNESIKKSHFVASFETNTPLKQVIEIISKLNKFNYEINQNTIYLSE